MENDDEGSTQGKYSWKRATDKRGEWKVVEGAIEMTDVRQGQMGDCYFLTALTALSNYPYLIKLNHCLELILLMKLVIMKLFCLLMENGRLYLLIIASLIGLKKILLFMLNHRTMNCEL